MSTVGSSPRTSGVFAREYRIADGSRRISATAFHNALTYLPQPGEKPAMTMVMGNGAFASRRSLKRFVGQMVQAATEDGQALHVVVHRDPLFGKAYAPAERMRRFARVALDSSDRYKQPLHLVGHSWSWRHAVNITNSLSETDARIASVTAYTPTGHPPTQARRNIFDLPKSIWKEAVHAPRTVAGFGSLAIMGSLAASALARFAVESIGMCREVYNSFRTDSTERVADISATASFVRSALVAEKDAFYPADATAASLARAGFLPEHIGTLDNTTHLSAVTDYRHGAELYRFMVAQQAQAGAVAIPT